MYLSIHLSPDIKLLNTANTTKNNKLYLKFRDLVELSKE